MGEGIANTEKYLREKQSGIASPINPYSDNDSEIRHITGFLSPQTSPRKNSEYAQSHSVRRQSEVNAFYKKIKKGVILKLLSCQLLHIKTLSFLANSTQPSIPHHYYN